MQLKHTTLKQIWLDKLEMVCYTFVHVVDSAFHKLNLYRTLKMSKALQIALTLAPAQLDILAAAVAENIRLNNSEKKGGVAEKYLEEAEYTKATITAAYEDIVEHIGKKEAKALLKAFDAKKVKDLDEENYKDFWTSAQEMLAEISPDGNTDVEEEGEGEDPEDEGEDDGEDEGIDREELKKAIQKIAGKDKEGAVEILNAAGLNTVRGMAKADEAALKKMFKAVKKYNK